MFIKKANKKYKEILYIFILIILCICKYFCTNLLENEFIVCVKYVCSKFCTEIFLSITAEVQTHKLR